MSQQIPLLRRVDELRAAVRQQDSYLLAQRIGARFETGANSAGELLFDFWGDPVRMIYPALEAVDARTEQALDPLSQAVLAYYLHESDGTDLAQRWVAFSELPDGTFYASSYQGYTGQVLWRHFGNDTERFVAAAAVRGERSSFSDIAFRFDVLPRVALLAACWPGDEDFPASYRILFDANIAHHLPTDGCAILGSMLTRMILRDDRGGVSSSAQQADPDSRRR